MIGYFSTGSYLMRCDRVELPPGGTAYLHTHRGPGIRCLVDSDRDKPEPQRYQVFVDEPIEL